MAGGELITQADIEKWIPVLKKHDGNITLAARELGIAHKTIRNYSKTNPKLADAIAEARAAVGDEVEANLFRSAKDPKGAPVDRIFALKHLKPEIYADRQIMQVEPSKLWFEPKQLEDQNPQVTQLEE